MIGDAPLTLLIRISVRLLVIINSYNKKSVEQIRVQLRKSSPEMQIKNAEFLFELIFQNELKNLLLHFRRLILRVHGGVCVSCA